ncbi:hypothetical protein AcidC75_05350, partial [Acidisoma sp. C75]
AGGAFPRGGRPPAARPRSGPAARTARPVLSSPRLLLPPGFAVQMRAATPSRAIKATPRRTDGILVPVQPDLAARI